MVAQPGWRQGVNCERAQGNSGGDAKAPYLDYGGNYMGIIHLSELIELCI